MTSTTLIRGGTVLTMTADGTCGSLDILIRDGLIEAIGPDLSADGVDEILDASGSVVMPGLIDTHRHLWYTPTRAVTMDHGFTDLTSWFWPTVARNLSAEDLYAATRAGIVDALSRGITTVLDYCHAIATEEHAERALEAHLSLPGRAVFGYGPALGAKEKDPSAVASDWRHAEATHRVLRDAPNSRISMALAIQNPAVSNERTFRGDVEAARAMGIPITTHMAPRGGGQPEGEVARIHAWDLLGPDLHFSHCCGTTVEEFALIRDAGVGVTVTPMAEVWLGLGLPPMNAIREAGLEVAIGADAICAATGDQFDEARATLSAARWTAIAAANARGQRAETAAELGMTSTEALAGITTAAAAACWMSDRIGSLEVGKAADIILLDLGDASGGSANLAGWVLGSAHGSAVHTVLVDGQQVMRNRELIGIDVQEVQAASTRARASMLR